METLKLIHMLCAMLSISGFVGRGVLLATHSPVMQRKWIRIVPHVIDTLLLGTAIAMVVGLGLSVLSTPWLLAKITALLVYIALGIVVMRGGKSPRLRIAAWLAAIVVFAYIVAVAVTKNPVLFLPV